MNLIDNTFCFYMPARTIIILGIGMVNFLFYLTISSQLK